MRARVVDASVLGALVFEEPRADEAAALLADAKLHAPFLLAYELASIARRKAVLTPDRSSLIMAALEDGLALELEWTDVDHTAALALALRYDLTTHDASYLTLAQTLDADLVSFDRKLEAAARALRR
ncbi:MAG: hypothetical protein AMXMBFR64_03140 [Myxococcales bacterium]